MKITIDSFGTDLPPNWEEIADNLNKIIDAEIDRLGDYPDPADVAEVTNRIWEEYWGGMSDGDVQGDGSGNQRSELCYRSA